MYKKCPFGKGWEILSTVWALQVLALVQGRAISSLQQGISPAGSCPVLCPEQVWMLHLHPSMDQMDQTIHGLGLEEESRRSPGDQQHLLERATGKPETKEALGFENKLSPTGSTESLGLGLVK